MKKTGICLLALTGLLLGQEAPREERVVEVIHNEIKETPNGFRVEIWCSNVTGVVPNRVGNMERIKLVAQWRQRKLNANGVEVGESKAVEGAFDITPWFAQRVNKNLQLGPGQVTWTLTAYRWALDNPGISTWSN